MEKQDISITAEEAGVVEKRPLFRDVIDDAMVRQLNGKTARANLLADFFKSMRYQQLAGKLEKRMEAAVGDVKTIQKLLAGNALDNFYGDCFEAIGSEYLGQVLNSRYELLSSQETKALLPANSPYVPDGVIVSQESRRVVAMVDYTRTFNIDHLNEKIAQAAELRAQDPAHFNGIPLLLVVPTKYDRYDQREQLPSGVKGDQELVWRLFYPNRPKTIKEQVVNRFKSMSRQVFIGGFSYGNQ